MFIAIAATGCAFALMAGCDRVYLMKQDNLTVKTDLRNGTAPAVLKGRVQQLLTLKPEISFKQQNSGTSGAYTRTMSQIGG